MESPTLNNSIQATDHTCLETKEQQRGNAVSEVGIEALSIGIFSLAVQHAGASPWETMFIGESLTESLAAQQAGMQAARIADPEADYADLQKTI